VLSILEPFMMLLQAVTGNCIPDPVMEKLKIDVKAQK